MHSLFEVPRGTWVLINKIKHYFSYMDGAYAKVETEDGTVSYISPLTEVTILDTAIQPA